MKEQEKQTVAKKKLEVAELYIKENARDEWLVSGLAGVEEQLGNLLAKQRETTQKEIALKKADTAVTEPPRNLRLPPSNVVSKNELDSASKNLQQGRML